MFQISHSRKICHARAARGFTLIELAIVLAVTGVLFLGLYRLLSGGNQQVKDTAVASQQIQLITAVKAYLASTDGLNYMGSKGGDANFPLPLPTVAPNGTDNNACKGSIGDANLKSFCNYLPAGFTASTVNAYGQFFNIQFQTGTITAPATVPSTYSFMIMTTAGDTIADADGGRISSQIGSDGGFIYANTNVCPSNTACGAFGAWSITPQGAPPGYGFTSSPFGHVATRTYISPETVSTLPWLARQLIDATGGTSTTSPNYNTMSTDLFLGNNHFYMAGNANVGASIVTTGVPALYLQGGSIFDSVSPGNSINISQAAAYLSKTTGGPSGSGSAALETLSTGCSSQNNAPVGPDCQVALQINGDENLTGELQAASLFAGTFVYQSSDMRLKMNIQPITPALTDIMRLAPVSYAFKSTGQKGMGFIAQDMEKIYPDLVLVDSRGMKALNYDGLIAPLVSAVQELKSENDELRQQLRNQTKRQDELEKALKQRSP